MARRLPPLILPIAVPAIAQNGSQMYKLHLDPLANFAETYAPFNLFTMQNLSGSNLQVIFNYSNLNSIIVPTGAFQTRKDQTYCNFQIFNNLAGNVAVNAGEVTVWVEKI